MRPNTENHLRHEGNLGERRQVMTLDENSLVHLMTVLTDLYSDEELAVIREYPINAVDSHKAAGTKRPIEVHLPTNMDPTFIVQDWGLGLSVDEVLNNFAKYGWSSKRETNDEVGMLGLGCKSALTYTNQFTLTAIKDGVKAEVLVSRGEDGVSGVEVIDTSSTNEPNGVTIRIPVRKVSAFNDKARRFFAHWRDPILVDGETPTPDWGDDRELWLDDDVLLVETKTNMNPHDIIVMGNIPYPVETNHSLTEAVAGMNGRYPKSLRYRAIIWVDVGSVDFTPSRESLHYTDRTIDTLAMARKFIWDRFQEVTQADIDAAETHTEGVKRASKWSRAKNSSLQHSRYTYRGATIPDRLTVVRPDSDIPGWAYDPLDDAAGKIGDYRCTVLTDNAVNYTWVTGHPSKAVSRRQRNQLRGYFLGEGSTWTRDQKIIIVSDMSWAGPWLQGVVVDWGKIEEVDPIPPNSTTPVKKNAAAQPTGYRVVTNEGIKIKNDHRDVNKARVAFASPADAKISSSSTISRERYMAIEILTKQLKQPYEVVLIHPRSFDRFKRENPRALSMPEAIIKEMKALKRRLTPLQQGAIWLAMSVRSPLEVGILSRLDESKINDPEICTLIKDLRKVGDQKLTRLWANLQRASWGYGVPQTQRMDLESSHAQEIRRIIDKYPLMKHLNIRGDKDASADIEDYINSLYHQQERA